MTKEQVLIEVSTICKELFKEPDLTISPETSPNDLEAWDSMNNLLLIDKIEDKFKIKFSLDDIFNAQNIGDICEIIFVKGSQ